MPVTIFWCSFFCKPVFCITSPMEVASSWPCRPRSCTFHLSFRTGTFQLSNISRVQTKHLDHLNLEGGDLDERLVLTSEKPVYSISWPCLVLLSMVCPILWLIMCLLSMCLRCPSSSSSKKLINPSSFGHMHPNVGVELYGCCRFLGCLDPWRVVEKYGPILRGAQMCLPVLLWVIRSPQGDILKMECTFVVHDVVRV